MEQSQGITLVNFCWVCAAGISEPLLRYSLFLVYFVASYKPHLSPLRANDFKVRPHSSNSIETAQKGDSTPVVKMQSHSAVHIQKPITRKCPCSQDHCPTNTGVKKVYGTCATIGQFELSI